MKIRRRARSAAKGAMLGLALGLLLNLLLYLNPARHDDFSPSYLAGFALIAVFAVGALFAPIVRRW